MSAATIDTATPQRILEAAGPIFADKGFEQTTVREICQAAGVNLASINYHFGDKSRLYVEAVTHARATRAAQVPMPKWAPDTPAESRLHDYVRTMLQRMLALKEAPWQVRLMVREIVRPTDACRAMIAEYFRQQFQLLLTILAELVPPDTEKTTRDRIGFSIVGQCFLYRAGSGLVAALIDDDEMKSEYTIERLAQHICHFSLAAIGRAEFFDRPG